MSHSPTPIFDSMQYPGMTLINHLEPSYNTSDIVQAVSFLKSYKGSQGTFNSYRREIERLIHWYALVTKKSFKELKRADIEEFIYFCQKPPNEWIGTQKPPRFIVKDGLQEEAQTLPEATVHWLRHAGISDDVKRRPREHVRDDAGLKISLILSCYNDANNNYF